MKKETKEFLIDMLKTEIQLEESRQRQLAQRIVDTSVELNERLKDLTVRRADSENEVARLRKMALELEGED